MDYNKAEEEQRRDDGIPTNDFVSDGVSSLHMNSCNVVSVLPHEYNQKTEIDEDDEVDSTEMEKHKPVCYYVLSSGAIEEQNAQFERPHQGMQNHLKPFYIRVKVEQVAVNKVLVDEGAAVNLMPQFRLKRFGMFDIDVKPHNTVLSSYEGKIGHTLGVIQVDLTVGSIMRPTMFMVVPAKANSNLLFGREWIHDVGEIPSTMHQRVSIWRKDGKVKNIEADQSYFMNEVNQVDKANFDRDLGNISPCAPAEDAYSPNKNALYFLTLQPNGFQWNREIMGDLEEESTRIRSSGWNEDIDHV